jgi:pilus assembly protein CpaB
MARSLTASPARTNRLFLVLALLLSVLSAVFVYMALNRDTGSSGGGAVAGETQTVVVARVPIGARETITADMLDRKQVPLSAVVTGAVENLEDAVGKVTLYPIALNQQISASAIADAGSAGTIDSLSFTIPPGKRAMSIAVDQVVSAGGLILPGDFVDIIGVFSVQTAGKEAKDAFFSRVVLENVQVLAVDQRLVKAAPVAQDENGLPVVPQGEENAKATTMTLLVDPRDAEWLFLADLNGKLRAVVRSYGDDAIVNPEPVTQPELIPPSVIAAYEAVAGQ